MSRKPSVRIREQDGWFYTTVGGKQIKLSQDGDEADREFHAILASHEMTEAPNLIPISPRKLSGELGREAVTC